MVNRIEAAFSEKGKKSVFFFCDRNSANIRKASGFLILLRINKIKPEFHAVGAVEKATFGIFQ